jgi:probable HAF family extracellular repeat protein
VLLFVTIASCGITAFAGGNDKFLMPVAGYITHGVSRDGTAAAGDSNFGHGGPEGFVWIEGQGSNGVGDLPGGAFESIAYGVSNGGGVVVGRSRSQNGLEAFRWTNQGIVGLGDLPGGEFASIAWGVSADGNTIVGRGAGANGNAAFRWTAKTGIVNIGGTEARGVTADGKTIVGHGGTQGTQQAFRWREGVGMEFLGDLPGGWNYSIGNDVSADGKAVLGWSYSETGEQAFLWREGLGMIGLGFPSSEAFGVTANGQWVVGRATMSDQDEAFIWDHQGGTRRLEHFLGVEHGLNLTGWQLKCAFAISDDGRTIGGWGLHGGITKAWVARVPEPTTWLSILAALLGVSSRRR